MKRELSKATLSLWAKSGEDGGQSLIAHSLDTAAVALSILELEPSSTIEALASDFGLLPDDSARLVCALAGLHDLGKASPAFQQKWPPGAARVREAGLTWSEINPPDGSTHHGLSLIHI